MRKIKSMCGYEVARVDVKRALRENPHCPYMKLALAFLDNKGVVLSAAHVRQLVDMDDAIAAAIFEIVNATEVEWA